jgi:hypothetical protein
VFCSGKFSLLAAQRILQPANGIFDLAAIGERAGSPSVDLLYAIAGCREQKERLGIGVSCLFVKQSEPLAMLSPTAYFFRA